MAGRMMNMGRSVAAAPRWAVSSCCLMVLVIGIAHAEELPDPTRPPSGIFATGAGTGGGAGTVREAAENRSTGLRTIIISDTRRAAIIDGKTVELGGEHGGAKLIEVNEGSVVMQRAQSRQVLALFPDVKITRKDTPDQESAKKESPHKVSPNKRSHVKHQSSTSNKMQSRKHKTRPTAHREEK
jgi:hypothetical protein